ncbi:chorismate mutase [Dysgonomonas gadei]|uniref:chorismate mutase n=1 Tax=Dysgonomonas gadei TaxID=156974 RepID=UPI003AF19124
MKSQNEVRHCSLDEVRMNIDKIDAELVRLIAKRSKFVSQAARFKQSTQDVVAPDRVSSVISKVRTLAEESGLNPVVAEKVYRTMINAFINEELAEFDSLYKEIKQSYY